MSNEMPISAISEAVTKLKALRPGYSQLLDFYEQLCLAQETAKKEIRLEPVQISEDILSAKRKGGFSLIEPPQFGVDMEVAESLLNTLCRLAGEANEVLAGAAKSIHAAVKTDSLTLSVLFSKVLAGDDIYLKRLADDLDVDEKILAFAAYTCIRPSLCIQARQLSKDYLDPESLWEKGYCPVCGSPPALSILHGEEGQRSLVCALCDSQWKTMRIFCPFCENRDQKRLAYFFSEKEKDCRVDVCDKCNRYIKTLDSRQMERPFYPFIEQVGSLHLDMIAAERGLESGVPLWLTH
jgi:FdhE protein